MNKLGSPTPVAPSKRTRGPTNPCWLQKLGSVNPVMWSQFSKAVSVFAPSVLLRDRLLFNVGAHGDQDSHSPYTEMPRLIEVLKWVVEGGFEVISKDRGRSSGWPTLTLIQSLAKKSGPEMCSTSCLVSTTFVTLFSRAWDCPTKTPLSTVQTVRSKILHSALHWLLSGHEK